MPRVCTCKGCAVFGAPGDSTLEDGLHLICRVAPAPAVSAIKWLYNILLERGKQAGACIHELPKILKAVSGEVKRGGKFIHRHWRYLTHWDTMFGYVAYKGKGAMIQEVTDWLVTRRDIGKGLMGEPQYVTRIYEECVRFLQQEWKMPNELPTAREWVRAGKWIRGRSGTGPNIPIIIEGKRKRTRPYKGVDAVLKSDDRVRAELYTPVTEDMVVMQKSEGGKIRPVVKTGNDVNRKMDFLSEVVEKGLYGCTYSTLFAGPGGNERVDEVWLEQVKDVSSLKVPLDQGGFDQHQSQATILAALKAIGDVCFSPVGVPQEYKQVWVALWDSLVCKGARVKYDGYTMSWGNGVPSGWRWTALLDTLLNIASFRVIRDHMSLQMGSSIPVGTSTFQGDDVLFTTTSVTGVAALVEGYNLAGYEVHPSKTYISRDRGEFLRRSYEPEGVTGYITRTQLALRFRNPVLEMPVVAAERVPARVHLWMLLRQRGALAWGVAECMLEDAVQAGVPMQVAADFILTPSAVGGVGLTGDESDVAGAVKGILATKEQYKAGERWVIPEISKPTLKFIPTLGQWVQRMARIGVQLTGDYLTAFQLLLARSWGIREADILGKVEAGWKTVARLRPRKPPPLAPLRKGSDFWDMDEVPVILRPILKQQVIDSGEFLDWVKPELRAELLHLRKRMTSTVFRIYMLDFWEIPSPKMDRVSASYGTLIKSKARTLALSFFAKKDICMNRLTRNFLWLEEWMGKQLEAYNVGKFLSL